MSQGNGVLTESPIQPFVIPAKAGIHGSLAYSGIQVARVIGFPLSRSIGSTFEHVFVLPIPANPGNPRPRKPRTTNPHPNQPNTTSRSKKPNHPNRPKLTPEQNKEFRSVRAAEERQRRQELGLCRECPNQTIKGQTRCPDCANKHSKAQKQQSSPAETGKGPIQERHTALTTEVPSKKAHSQSPTKQHKPTPDSETTASVKRQEYEQRRSQRPERKEAARQAARKRRDRRIAAGICVVCEGTPIPGETKCEVCAEKHRIARSKSQAKRRGRPTSEGTTPTEAGQQ